MINISKYYKSSKWHFRDNYKRLNGKSKNGKHPSLIVGETDDKSKYINIGLTHGKKRGHHTNIEIYDPTDWNKKSRLRDDIKETDKKSFSNILINFKLNPEDYSKVNTLINKHKKKNSHKAIESSITGEFHKYYNKKKQKVNKEYEVNGKIKQNRKK